MREFRAIPVSERRRIYRSAFLSSVPILLGYTTMGFAAGVLMGVAPNMPCAAFWSGFLALSTVSGTLSFVIPDQIHVCSFSSLVSIALLTLAINFRYAFYGFSMLNRWKGIPFWQKYFLVHSLADEIYAIDLTCAETDPVKNRLFCLTNHALDVFYWFFGTSLGALAGATLPIPSKGIEFAMVALFLVIFTDQIRGFLKK